MSPTVRRTFNRILVTGAVAGLAGCGGDDEPQVRDACGTTSTPVAQPSATLTYRGATSVAADVPVLCDRLEELGTGHRLRTAGRDRLVVEVPRSAAAEASALVRPGRLVVYDWERNVIGPRGRTAPFDPRVTGGAGAGSVDALTLYDAVLRASRRPARDDADNGRDASAFYAVDTRAKDVLGPDDGLGSPTRAAALAAVSKARRASVSVREVRPGTVLVRASPTREGEDKPDRWYVLEDDVALRGDAIVDPRQEFAEGPRSDGRPILAFDLTAAGATAFTTLTRELAERGSRVVGVVRGQPAADANQHFAIVLDGEILSIPYIDFRINPGGVAGGEGLVIEGGFTIKSARQLAKVIDSGELPVPLRLVDGP